MRAKVRKPQGAKQFIVDPGGEIVINPGGVMQVAGEILVKNGGRINAELGQFIVDPGGEIVINPGGVMQVAGEILVKNGGRINAELGGSIIADNLAELTPKKGAAATLTTALGVAHAELVFTAKARGPGGNDITIEYVDPVEANAAVAVEVTGNAIKVLLAPGGGGAITTTANDIIAAFADNALVSVAKKAANDGTGVVTAMVATALAGGQDSTPAKKGDMYFDATNVYIAIDDVAITDDGSKWRKIQHAAL